MIDQARAWGFMEENGCDFIVTGEVVGQRPKSQRRDTMPLIARESGAKDRLLRPLTALNLPPTLPEREGWVNREHLYGFHGRNRKPQIELAARFGFEEFAQPAGGCCFLTDEKYSAKLADLWRARGERDYSLDDIMLLKVGRHLRPADHFKVIVARDDGENNFLEGYRKQFVYLRIDSHEGPLTLIDGQPTFADIEVAARIAARYSQGRNAALVQVSAHHPGGVVEQLSVAPIAPHQIPDGWHV
jgi:tRNA U34 2-thiouridine synthase MnmA/TrmU